jgi:hypothetical protein
LVVHLGKLLNKGDDDGASSACGAACCITPTQRSRTDHSCNVSDRNMADEHNTGRRYWKQ